MTEPERLAVVDHTWLDRDRGLAAANATRLADYELVRSLRQSHDVTLNAPYRAETNITQIKKRAGK